MTTEITKQSTVVTPQFNFFDAEQFATMQRVSKMFSASELVPDMYKPSDKVSAEKAAANCMIALSLAQRIGADPLMVMQNLVIIYGRPTWSSKFLVATVNTCGRFENLKYKFENLGKIGKIKITEYVWDGRRKVAQEVEFDGTDIDNIQCIAYSKERATGETLESSEVSIKMAIEERWYTKDGSKWRTMPKKMLIYRAASFWTNEHAPEISMGMKTVEEAEDIEDIDYEDVTDKGTSVGMNQEADKQAASTPLSMDNAEPATAMKPNENASNPDWNAADDNAPTVQKNF